MSTYEEFMVILTAGILLVSILEFAIHKKVSSTLQLPCPSILRG